MASFNLHMAPRASRYTTSPSLLTTWSPRSSLG